MRIFLNTRAFSILIALVSSTPLVAQECTGAVQVNGLTIAADYQSLSNRALRLASSLGAQQFDIDELADAQKADVPAPPDAPVVEAGLFDDEGELLWVCNADGAEPSPDENTYELALTTFDGDLDAFEAEISARADQIAALLEEPAVDDTDLAEAEPEDVPPSTDEQEGSQEPDVAEDAPQEDSEIEGDDVADAGRVEPMKDPDNENLFRRVLSLPQATLRDTPDIEAGTTEVPTFSVLYVFDETSVNGRDWLQVGASLREGSSQGWIEKDQALNWSSMLVMEFAPKGKRSDVLFFESDVDLVDMVKDFTFEQEAQRMYSGIESERARLQEEPNSEPSFDPRLIAMEPRSAISYEEQPYLLPILDWRLEQLFDNLYDTTLLQVAAVPADAQAIETVDTQSIRAEPSDAAQNDGIFRVGVVFVVDTTVSMRPFIERTYQTIQSFYDSFQQYESASFVSFGLVGFRDEDSEISPVEYTTRMFQPLNPDARAREVLGNMRQMREATTATIDFKEDVFAGVIDGIENNDWTPYDLKLIILITDASARSGDDPRAKYDNYTPQAVQQLALNKGVAVVPIHLRTPANLQNGDLQIGEEQYRQLSATGDINFGKYFQLDAADQEGFTEELNLVTRELAAAVFNVNAGKTAKDPDEIEFEEIPESEPGGIAAAVVNEVFRAQLESLAAATNGASPSFLAGWTADRDLLDPDFNSLEVSVFLTRNQLSTLDKRLGDIVDAFRSAEDDPQAFFDRLQFLAAETSTDPDLARTSETEAMRALLPSFLQNLPYRSQALDLRREDWAELGIAGQARFIETLEGKRKIYQDISEEINLWQDFGGDGSDPLLQVTPISLNNLP